MSADPFKKIFESVDPTRGVSAGEIDKIIDESQIIQRLHERTWVIPRGRSARPWRRAAIISSVMLLVITSAAAAITFLRSPITNTSQMSCYSQDSVHSKVISELPYGPHPLSSCKSEMHWRPVPSSPTPAGLLCVLPNGTLGGFPPSKELRNCSMIGLATFNGKLKYPHVFAFERAVHAYFEDHACPAGAAAEQRMRALIGKFGLAGWVIQVTGSKVPGACATFAIQPSRRRVDLVEIDERRQ